MSETSMSYLYTIGGYAALAGLGYVAYHVSTQKTKKRSATAQPKTARASQPEPRKDDKKKKQRMERFASEAQESSGKAPAEKEEPTWLSNGPSKEKADDGVDNREFAKQLAKAKAGTQFVAKSDGGKQREKSVKQSRANQMSGAAKEEKVSEPSSSSGIDAEADVDEPAASSQPAPVDVSGVADMLAPAPAAPSILRITDTSSKNQKPKATKAPEQVETKKQRQNRKKAEAAKAARQEAEGERKVLEEKQRRQARIAEGRAAKDGSQFMAVNGNKSAWNQGSVNGNSTKAEVLHQPLDTFEQPAVAEKEPVKVESANPEPVKAAPAATRAPGGTWTSSLPSEEEQMEMLKDEADEWSTVKTKKPAKKSSSADSGDEPTIQSQPAPVAKQPSNSSATSRPMPAKNFGGSFSALTTKDEPAEEAEEEWDV